MSQVRHGRVKWFDVAKHFGFITLDDGHDALVHANCVTPEQRTKLREKTPVTCKVAQGPRGLQVSEIVDLQWESTVLEPGQLIPAVVKWYSVTKGFGFVICANGPDVFIHAEVVKAASLIELLPDQKVLVAINHQSPRGPKVLHVRLDADPKPH